MTEIADVPQPKINENQLMVRSTVSLVSNGTEKMLIEFGKGGYLQKAKSQPDKVKQVLDKLRTDGIVQTIETVQRKLEQPLPLGYCNVGVVEETGLHINRFKNGDRVVSNGYHAEFVAVSENLCAKIPDNVSDTEAAFTVLGSIALQGIRLSRPTLGETFAVFGLGIIGLLAVQILRANGCKVIAIDPNGSRRAMAERFGAKALCPEKVNFLEQMISLSSNGMGVDGVIITAATKSDVLIHQAAYVSRKRGRIILVGVVGLNLRRDDFYEKELTFQVSCSYGPGRYDSQYEEKGIDYPQSFVRWTEQRNFQAILQLMSDKKIDVSNLVSHNFKIENGVEAMDVLLKDKNALGIILNYPKVGSSRVSPQTVELPKHDVNRCGKSLNLATVGVIGAGNYSSGMLIPAFSKTNAKLHTLVSKGGVTSYFHGKRYKFSNASTDIHDTYLNEEINTIVVATRHDQHFSQVISALQHEKHVYCEKPLCLNEKQLEEIRILKSKKSDLKLMVGFNRRFSPAIKHIKQNLLPLSEKKSFVYNINAGYIEPNHWIHDQNIGGGRLIGEACHFVDLLQHLTDSSVSTANIISLDQVSNFKSTDTLSIQLKFEDGSIGVINYFSNGNKSLPKEKLDIYCGGRVITMNNYRSIKYYGFPHVKNKRFYTVDKGQKNCVAEFIRSIEEDTNQPIDFQDIVENHKILFYLNSNLL